MGDRASSVRHAITAPQFDQDKAHRSRLIDDLQLHLQRRLILVAAPAGYGKTTFLADFTEHSDIPVAWVRLTEADQDPTRLARLVWASLTRRFHRLKNTLDLEEHSGSKPEALAELITGAIHARVPEDFVLLLDDIHLVNQSESSLAFVDNLIRAQPQNMTTVISGREVPAISLVPLIAKDALKSYGAEDLALDLEELQEILRLRLGRQVSEAQALKLLEETGGWVTGLLLSDLLAGERLPSLAAEPQSLTYEYLASAVFDRQPQDLKEFLLSSAALPVMTAQACDVALGRGDSDQRLIEIMRKGLFLSVTGDKPRTYEYHHLFRAFLLAHPSQDEETIQSIRLSAADYFAEADDPETAFDLYMAAEEVERAASFAGFASSKLYDQGRIETLRHWVTSLERVEVCSVPTSRRLALLLMSHARYGEAEKLLQRAEKQASDNDDDAGKFWCISNRLDLLTLRDEHFSWREMLGELENLVGGLGPEEKVEHRLCLAEYSCNVEMDMHAAIQHMDEAERIAERYSCYTGLLLALQRRGYARICLGEPEVALRDFVRALEISRSENAWMWQPMLINDLAMSELSLGNYEAAYNHVKVSLKSAIRLAQPRQEMIAALSMGELHSDLGFPEAAQRYLNQGVRLARSQESEFWEMYGLSQLANLHRRSGNEGDLVQVQDKIRLTDAADSQYWGWICKLETLFARHKDAPGEVARQVEIGGLREFKHALTKAHVWLAETYIQQSCLTEAIDHLITALKLADQDNTLQLIAGEANASERLRMLLERELPTNQIAVKVLKRVDEMNQFAAELFESSKGKGATAGLDLQSLGRARVPMMKLKEGPLRPMHLELLYFIVERGKATSNEIFEVFWPDSEPEARSSNLHTAIYSLRDVLGPEVVKREGMGYKIDPEEPIRYDADLFDRAVQNALRIGLDPIVEKQVLREAISLYAGEFLPNFASDWIISRRQQLNQQFADACVRYSGICSTEAEYEFALRACRRALSFEPYREDLNLAHLEILHSLNRVPEIRLQYLRFRKRLSEDLQLTPSEEFEFRYQELIDRRSTEHPIGRRAS